MKTLLNEHVTSVTCGGSHTVVVTKRGSVYTFGYGMHGQLGHGPSSQDVPLPKLVTALQKRFVTAVSCGESHTALLTRRGELLHVATDDTENWAWEMRVSRTCLNRKR